MAAAAARVHLGPLRAVPDLLARMGVPWEPVLRHARILLMLALQTPRSRAELQTLFDRYGSGGR